jgi:hypothetical protein
MMSWNRHIVLAVISLIAVGCAGPTLQVPKPSQSTVESERQYQEELAFKQMMDAQIRVFQLYAKLRTDGAALCGNNVKPFAGLFLKDLNSFVASDRPRAARVLRVDNNVRVIATGTPAVEAGVRQGDILRKIGGTVVQPRSFVTSKSDVEDAMRLLDKAELRPVEIEVERPEETIRMTITPKLACRFGVDLQIGDKINAAADGEKIFLPMGMLRFAASDDELALVLGHELAHNALEHINRSKTNRAAAGAFGALFDIAAAVAGVNTGGAATRAAAQIGAKAYSQAFESEADYLGLYLVARAGFDASRAPDFWRKMAVANPDAIQASYGSTHPSTPERAVGLQETLKEIRDKQLKGEPLVPARLNAMEGEKESVGEGSR